eukprot:6334-Heterococcus_DN1.PRE.4
MSYVYAGRICYLALVLELHSCITSYAAVYGQMRAVMQRCCLHLYPLALAVQLELMDEGRDNLKVKIAQKTAERKARQEERSRLRDQKNRYYR